MVQYGPLAPAKPNIISNPIPKALNKGMIISNNKSNVVTKPGNTLIGQSQKQSTPTTEKPKFNLFDFSTLQVSKPQIPGATGGGVTPPTISGQTLPQTPQKPSAFSSWLVPQASAIQSKPMNLFSDEQEAFNKMKEDGLDEQKSYELLKQRRKDLMEGNTKLTPIESAALLKMQQDGLKTDEAINFLKEYRSQPKEDTRPLWKKAGEGAVNFMAGNLETVLKYGGNILDLGTGGKAGFGEDVTKMTEQNKEIFKDSSAFKTGKVMPDIALAVAPVGKAIQGMGLIKGGATVGAGFGALQPVLEKGSKTTAGDVVQGGAIGGTLGAVTGGLLKGAGKTAEFISKKLPSKLQLSGLINPSKLDAIKNAIISEGEKSPDNVAKWMLDRGIKGDKETIIKMLQERANNSMTTLNEGLSKIKTKVKSQEAKTALEQLYKDLSGISGMETKASEIGKLLNKKSYSLTELNQIKRELDNVYNIYKASGEVSAGLKAQGLNNVRRNLKTIIEKKAENAGFNDVQMLNNETQVSKGLAEGIAKKDNADYVRELLSPFASRVTGGIIGSQTGPFDNNTIEGRVGNVILGAVIGGATQSTKVKTNVASLLNKLTKSEISVLDKYLTSNGTSKISQGLMDKVGRFIKGLK